MTIKEFHFPVYPRIERPKHSPERLAYFKQAWDRFDALEEYAKAHKIEAVLNHLKDANSCYQGGEQMEFRFMALKIILDEPWKHPDWVVETAQFLRDFDFYPRGLI